MATARQIHVRPSDTGLLRFDQDSINATAVTEFLQKDLESHHTFFNLAGLHNHIVHHLLALYGTGADLTALEEAWGYNFAYQLALTEPRTDALDALRADYDSAAPAYLGDPHLYPTFLAFFQDEIDAQGWQAVLVRYLFPDTDSGCDLRARMFAGLLHPLIQLLYGVEWSQPAIVASALAQAAVHKNELGGLLTSADARAAADPEPPHVHLVTLLEDLTRGDEHRKLRESTKWEDDLKMTDGVYSRAKEEVLNFIGRIRVKEEDLEERTAEMVHTAAYLAASTTVRASYAPKYDFFLIHFLNATPLFVSLNKLPWVPTQFKIQLLEWKMRLSVVNYIARGCPPLQSDLLDTYEPIDPTLVAKPEDLLPRLHRIEDDGHIVKVARSLLIAQLASQPYADRAWFRIRSDREWLAAHYLLVDSVKPGVATWVRSAGFPQAWEKIPEKDW